MPRCAVQRCEERTSSQRGIYCRIHECPQSGCYQLSQQGGVCRNHNCAVSGCRTLKRADANHCDRHNCPQCGGVKYANDRYCVHHQCGASGCLTAKRSNEHYCSRHTCQRPGCDRLCSYAQNYCERLLHQAAWFGSIEDVQLLLRNGANPPASINSWTPAFYANCFRDRPAIPVLIEAGLDVNYQDGGGWTFLHLAAKSRSRPLLDCLFRLGADPHIKGAPDNLYWKQFHEKSQVIGESERHTTPLDVARGQGEEYYDNFLLAAREAGIDISWDSEGDAFWSAEENLSAR